VATVEYAAVTSAWRRRASAGALSAALALVAGSARGDAIPVSGVPVALSEADPRLATVGALEFRGGLRLSSPDGRFGGLSALHVSADGSAMTAIGDEGAWVTARLEYDAAGRLAGVAGAELGLLHGLDGRPLADKEWQDAESLALLPDGAWLVGFERQPRLWAFRGGRQPLDGRPTTFTAPPGLERAPANGGLESLALLPDGRLIAITEELSEHGLLVGWVGRDGNWQKLHYRGGPGRAPSDATALPSGDLLVLERGYSPASGNTVQLRRIPARLIEAGAVLDGELLAELKPPLTVDNYEGLSTRRDARGDTLVYIFSDDNFNPLQRTLLLMFALKPGN